MNGNEYANIFMCLLCLEYIFNNHLALWPQFICVSFFLVIIFVLIMISVTIIIIDIENIFKLIVNISIASESSLPSSS